MKVKVIFLAKNMIKIKHQPKTNTFLLHYLEVKIKYYLLQMYMNIFINHKLMLIEIY